MALLDVTDLLTDPDFAVSPGEITVMRRAETPGNDGRSIFAPTTIDISQPPYSTVVIAAGARALQMLPDLARASGAIEVITTFALSGPEPGLAPDLVVWQAGTYTVEHIDNFTNFGAGFTIATCSLRDV